MKTIPLLLGVALSIVTISACSESKKETSKEEKAPNLPTMKSEGLKIAFYYSDSLRTNFLYYKQEDERMTKKGQTFQNELMVRQKSIQQLEQRFGEYYKSGTATPDEMSKIEAEINRKREQFANYQQSQGSVLEKETNETLEVISKKIEAAGKKYCAKYNIDMLLINGPGGQINYISDKMNVTASFIEFLNNEQEALKKDMGE